MAEFSLNPEILQTASGTITGDIAQIQTAIYGREVRASIAECLYLLLQRCEQSEAETENLRAEISGLKNDFEALNETISETIEELMESKLKQISGYPDLDGDGRVSMSDVSLILDASALGGSGGDTGLTEKQQELADINGDGVINAEDAALISEFSAGLGVGLYQNDAAGWMKFKKSKGIL